MSVKPAEFIAWPKIARWEGETMTITEKIDGTNACIVIDEYELYCQSRNRLISPNDDNAGFARWAHDNEETLRQDLGHGRFYGEWWGLGIQRNYGMQSKHFSLFNTHKFAEREPYFTTDRLHVVPVLYDGPFSQGEIDAQHWKLQQHGSVAALGFERPEGIVVRLHKSGATYKITDAVQGQKQRSASE